MASIKVDALTSYIISWHLMDWNATEQVVVYSAAHRMLSSTTKEINFQSLKKKKKKGRNNKQCEAKA